MTGNESYDTPCGAAPAPAPAPDEDQEMEDAESSSGSSDTSHYIEYSDIEWDPGDIDSDGGALVDSTGEPYIPMEEKGEYEEDEAALTEFPYPLIQSMMRKSSVPRGGEGAAPSSV